MCNFFLFQNRGYTFDLIFLISVCELFRVQRP